MILEAPVHLLESVDESLTELMAGAPFVVALGIAALLGLRHASDPDHLVAVTSLAADDRDASGAVRLGAWWGLGHAATLLAVGLPLVLLETALPGWLESGAEKLIGAVIILLGLRVLFRWIAARREQRELCGRRDPVRTSRQALAVGVLHGVAGTGAVVVLLLAQLPSQSAAAFALLAFAPMSMISMVACTGGFAWALTRPAVQPLYSAYVLPALGAFSLLFGAWYAGIV